MLRKIVIFANHKKLVLWKKFFVIIVKFLIPNVTKCYLGFFDFLNALNAIKQAQHIFVHLELLWIVIMLT